MSDPGPKRTSGADSNASASPAAPSAVGVLVMAYGTPASPEDVEPYYTHIRRGRAPSAEQLANLRMRYDALGGTSTLAGRTRDQLSRLTSALDTRSAGGFRVALGQKHAAPFVEDGVAELVAAGVDRIVGLVLAPHYSGFSIGQYHERAAAVATEAGVGYAGIDEWHDLPAYREFLAAAVAEGLAGLPEATRVYFTAHSLPERVLEGDPYPDQLLASAEGVATAGGLEQGTGWSMAWQSAGATPEPWRGPDILEVIRELADTDDVDGILVCPQGFVADHLEVAFDLDIEARKLADEVGIAFARTRVLNDDATVFAALADEVIAAARPAGRAARAERPTDTATDAHAHAHAHGQAYAAHAEE